MNVCDPVEAKLGLKVEGKIPQFIAPPSLMKRKKPMKMEIILTINKI